MMEFFGIGMGEIVLILVVALIIWGPGRVVEIGQTMGKVVRTLRKATFDLMSQVTKELEIEEKDRSSGKKDKD
ncbi:twin-arginine translocase TatA/TatE family subunit [Chloroflexota bacterium]